MSWLLYVKLAEGVIALASAAIGLLSLWAPARSIRLYQAIMRLCNWDVRPINAAQELRNTRLLGGVLLLLATLLVGALGRI